jgi:hypothetical protein
MVDIPDMAGILRNNQIMAASLLEDQRQEGSLNFRATNKTPPSL